MPVRLTIKPVQLPSGSVAEFTIEAEVSLTVGELKEQVAERVGMPKAHVRLVCAGRIWQDVTTVGSYEPQDGAIVHCLNNAPRAAPAAAAPGAPAVVPPAAGGDPFQSMMAQAQQMMQNPQMMQQLMSSPMVQQMMSDPETVRAMLRMNPQLSQLMEQRPEIARLLDDPEVLQQSMRLAANPSLMREMTRNADRAIGQLDAAPGGHDALLRAHADFADPLYEALSGSGNNDSPTTGVPTYTQPTEGGPNSAALPNPWGAPAAAPAPAAPVATPAAATVTPAAAAPGAGGMDPMAAMMQSMFAPPPTVATQPQTPAANPMATMMQQMMSDPAQMQQMMSLTRQLMAPQAGAGAGTQAATAAPAQQNVNPFAAAFGMQPGTQQSPAFNPMLAMMQQMMADPQQQQLSANLAQLMGGGSTAALPAMPGQGTPAPGAAAAASPPASGATAPAPATPAPAPAPAPPSDLVLAQQRVRFASQLSQLVAMGFTNEAACLRALAQHGGRVDAAIDTLLADGSQ